MDYYTKPINFITTLTFIFLFFLSVGYIKSFETFGIASDNVDILISKGAALGGLGNFTEAIKYFDKVLTIEPDNVDALNNIGAALGSLGNFTEAIKYFDKVLAIEPDNVKALISKDKALGNLDNHTKEVR